MNTDVVQIETETVAGTPGARFPHPHPAGHDATRWWRLLTRLMPSSRSAPSTMPPDGPYPPRRRSPIVLFVGLLCITVAVAAGLIVMNLRENALVEAEHEFDRLSRILADQAERDFEAVDLLQTDLVERVKDSGVRTADGFREAMTGHFVQEELATRARALSQLDGLSAIDENGRLINISRDIPIPNVDLSDRDYFRALRANPEETRFIGQTVRNRVNGLWSIYNARKVTGPNGEFLGLILGILQSSYFEQRYHAVAHNETMALSLFRQDGILLARYPQADLRIGKSYAMGGVFARLRESPTGSLVSRQPGQADGVDKLIAARLVRRYPLAVTVTAPVASVLADWRRQATYFVAAAALLDLMIVTLGLLMTRQLRAQHMLQDARAARAEAEVAQRGAEAELTLAQEQERASRELHIQSRRFEAALSNMTLALGMFDASDILIVASRQMASMFGVAPESIVPGMTTSDLLQVISSSPDLAHVDAEAIKTSFQRFISERKRVARLRELASGRTLAVNYVPVEDGGWLFTIEDITERRQVEAKIAHMAHHDALTGLPNRVLFHDRLAEAVARSRRGQPCAVLFLDLDHFKAVNDTLGHPAGDALLREVTARLNAQVREVDTVARLGGDEFAVVQSSANQPADATALALRLIETISAPYDLGGQQVIIGTSVGIAVVPGDGDDPDELLKNADMALYRAKADGRGRYRFFEPSMDAAMQDRRTLELDLRKALADGQFKIFYQPLVNVQTRSLTGFEALTRWLHPQRGIVTPAEFIPLAEEIGMIVPLGEWVLRQACIDAAGWPGTPKVAVNLSPLQFASRTLVQDVASALAASGLDPARLELEITETVMLADIDAVLVILHQLRGLGVGIAMDDFGTGYSSLSYLRRFPFSKVKIDRSFVEGMGKHGDCDTIIEAVAALCKRLGMTTTAEGVETNEQLARLSRGECTEAQGYLFSEPRPADEVAGLCARLTQPDLRPAHPAKSTSPQPTPAQQPSAQSVLAQPVEA